MPFKINCNTLSDKPYRCERVCQWTMSTRCDLPRWCQQILVQLLSWFHWITLWNRLCSTASCDYFCHCSFQCACNYSHWLNTQTETLKSKMFELVLNLHCLKLTATIYQPFRCGRVRKWTMPAPCDLPRCCQRILVQLLCWFHWSTLWNTWVHIVFYWKNFRFTHMSKSLA